MFFCSLRQFFLCLLLVLCFSLSTADSGRTQSPPLTFPPADKPAVTSRPLDSKKTVSFRRWLAPLDRIDDWPYGPGRYIQFNREQFEQWVTQLTVPHDEPGTIVPNSKKSPFSEIVLRAEWEDGQLVRGTGSLRLQNCSVSPQEKTQKTRCCSFAPPGFWMDSPKLEDGTPVPLVCGADGTFKFILPVAENTVSDSKNCLIHFRWSLRSRLTSQQGTVFDFTLPPCPAAELQLTLPDSLIPSLSGGIVQEEPVQEQEIQEKNGTPVFKHWRIFFGRQSLSTLTVSSRKKVAAKQRQTGIRQTLVYNIAPQGTDIRSTFVFDKTETRISELSFDLDPSLRLIEILYGDQRVPWTPYFSDDYPSGTGIIVDLSNVSKNEQRELTLRAISAAANEPFFRHLPRIRIVSDNVFWQETRCHIIVQNPYKVQAVNAPNAVRVSPGSSAERTDREVLTFQFFEADAAVSVMLADLSPKVSFDSAVQILLGNNDIQGTVTVDAGVTDGNCYVLSLPLSDAWTVDSVKSVYRLSDSVKTADGNEIAFWDITDSGKTTAEQTKPPHKQNVLSLQLKQPLLPKQTLRFRITGRCQMDTEKEHRLEEIVPLAPEIQKKGTHLLAVQPLPPFHLQYRSPIPALPEVSGFFARLSQNFGEPPLGTVIQLDAQSREIPFGITRLKPNYSAEITQTVTIQEKELILSCLFQCRPLDSSVDRIYVHFTGGHESFFQSQRFWSSGSDSIQSRVLSAEEQAEVLDSPDVADGEMWEIRFASPQTSPFEINVTATFPLPEMFPVPLAAVPAASLQKGTITVESPHPGQYRILNTHTHIRSFPVAAPENTHYQTVWGAFRYDPAERLPSALILQRLRPEELPPAAWIWSLRLNSQYEPEGFVKNNAVFFLENQGKKHLRITLPDGITAADVRTVRQNGQRISWYPEQKTQKHEMIVIPMPEKIRFVSVSLEYSYQDTPLIRQRHLKPKYPSADVPILTKHWAVWFPPDFEVLFNGSNLRQTFDGTKSRQTAALNGSLLYPFLPGTWKQVLYGAKQRSEAENAVSVFFGQIEDKLNESSREENSNERTKTPRENILKEKTLVWADLFGKEKELSNAFNELQEEGEKTAGAKIFIDKHALTMLGITPSSAVKIAGIKRGAELFEQSGLTVLLASKTAGRNKEYSFYITSTLLCALHQRFHSLPLGNTSRYFPENESIPVYIAAEEPDSRFSAAFSPGKTPDWVPAAEWNSKTSFPAVQWSLSPQMIPFISAIPEWNCFEVPQNTESPVRLINRQIYTSYHYFAFLLAVVLTSSKRFSHPLLLITLLLFFGITTRYITPCYAGIAYGVFLGTLVSFGFGLIRSRTLSAPLIKASMPNRRIQPDSPTHIGNITSDSTSDGEKTARETSISSSLLQTVLLLFLFLVLSPPNVSGQESAAEPAEWTKDKFFHPLNIGETEPYRVFFPVDKEQRITGNTVWIPMDFLQFLSQNVRNTGQNTPQDWNIERAEYQGTLGTFVHRSQTQLLELSDDFKATYEIRLNTDNAVILLPPLPLRQDHVLWDARPVPVTQRTTKDGKYDALLLPIENETAGKHVLVLSLSPKQELLNDICRISLDIPKVPNTVLRLKTPQDAPPIRVAHSLGAVIPNSLEETTLTAQIGPSEKLAFSWNSEVAGNNSPFIEADQYFRLSARMTQVEMRVVFRLRIDSGKIRQLQIQTDPRWHRSGQFYCEDVPIDSVETSLNSENNNAGKGTNPGEVTEITRIVFQKPVSGTVTLEAGFVLHDFNGIGKIRLPQFKTLNAKINRSSLAVFSDSLLQLDYPKTGLSANWNTEKTEIPDDAAADTPRTSSSPFSNPGRSEKTGNSVAGSASAAETEMRAAEYDLLKTDSSWVLAVRTKKQIPVLTQYQSVLLDDGNAAVVCRNEFQITGEVSQQRFTVPKNLEIESVEALNTEKNPVEIRWGKMNETEKPLEEYNVFFCRPISGKYSLIVRGHFPAKIKELAEKKHPVPQLVFQDVFVKEMLLTLFRTPSVIAGITADGTAWTSSDNRGKPLGFDGTSDSPYLPLRSYQWTAPSPEAGISAPAPPPLPLSFQLSPNRPEIRGEQITTLRRNPRDLWEISFDALWDISNGECNTVSFLWDSRCSSILSVEPQMPYSIQHGDGQPVLTLFPSHPLSGKQHIQIQAAFDTSGTSVSVPRIVLQTENTPKTEISRYLILPRYADESVIPWNHTLLAQADAETQEYLKSITETSDSDFFFLHALGSNYSANIIREKNRSVSNFFDIAFFVQKDGTLYGTATIDLKTLGQDNFTLYLPSGYELIQFSSGSISKGIKVSENRWKFDLWNGDYPHRLHIIFRSTIPKTKKELNVFPVALKFPVLEGVSVLQTVWTVSFASYPGQSFSPFFVSSVKENLFGLPAVASSQELSGETVTELGRYTPVAEIYSVPAQLKLNLIRLDNLLKILDTFSASSAAFKTEDGRHWLSLWSKEWNRIEKNVEEQSPVFSSVISADTAPILLDSGEKNAEELLSEYIWTILESTNLSPPFQALKQNYLNKTAEKLGREEITAGTPLLVPDASFYGLEGHYNIFGVSEGEVKELRLRPLPNTSLWTFSSSGTLLFWIALPLFLLLLSRKNLLTNSFLQFPHFWGTAAGLLFWSFCPPGLIGQMILLLTLLSFLYPAWKKRRVMNNG